MKRMLSSIVLAMILFCSNLPQALAAQVLVPGGELVGLELKNEAVTVAAFDDTCSAGREGGLQIGDQILSIDGKAVHSAADVRQALKNCPDHVEITLLRGSRREKVTIRPEKKGAEGRLGVYLRQGIAGVGTITFFDPDTGRFGTLGHGVSDTGGGLLTTKSGILCPASVASVKKGKAGDPGQLRGNAQPETVLGTIEKNTPQGVFGTCGRVFSGTPLPIAEFSEVKTGPATIRSTVEGDRVREYSVEILKIYPKDRPDCRNFLLKVTDPDLLKATGGIVQGMSGSPIIQDGRLIGAVTHVLVNDPTRGYGIFIENMLDAAS